ncbi:dipeptide epimerase [Candidatus Parvarchaeota archaeon]|nr:dipeptide epimerase [Candidatus Parvarchaeota archaeon]
MKGLKKPEAFPIEEIAFKVEALLLKEPLRIANENYTSSKTVFVRIKSKGFEGIGEAAPDKEVTNEDFHSVSRFIEKANSELKDMDSFDIQGINREMDKLSKVDSSAKAGVDIALYDLIGKISKRNVTSLLQGKGNSKPISVTIGIENQKLSVKHARLYKCLGFKIIKIKVGLDVDGDLKRIANIRKELGNTVKLVADANQGYTLQEAEFFLSKAGAFNLGFLEQPVKFSDFHSLKKLKEESSIPIMADESVKSIEDLRRLADIDAVSMINIKLMKMGGITKAMQIANEARSKNIGVMVGCMEESRVGIAAGMHLSFSIRDIGFADLDAHLTHINRFVYGGLKTVNGKNIIGKGYGLGLKFKKGLFD